MKMELVLLILILCTFSGYSSLGSNTDPHDASKNESKTALLYGSFTEGEAPNIAQLNLFFLKLPKGGDIHHHLLGSIYVESFLDWVDADNQCIDKSTLKISDDVKDGNCISVDQLRSDPELYAKLLTLWSDYHYHDYFHSQLPPNTSFFNTFGYLWPLSDKYKEGLMILRERAIKENVSYIETMIDLVGYSYQRNQSFVNSFETSIRKAESEKEIFGLLDELSSKINADVTFDEKIGEFIHHVEKAHEGVDDDQFMMRYQTFALRDESPTTVFSGLYAAFKAAERSKLLVGVNLVGPENGAIAIADYTLHMQYCAYLKRKFPKVNLALHAGELTLGMVRPKDLKFHVSQALNIAGAQRIGHGVDLPYEENAIGLLGQLKEKAVVEINLTSNEFILEVEGREHPYLIYSAYDVPMVICTDDSGVSRNNLSREFVLLDTRYKPSYETIKKYIYNTIRYSFLSEGDKRSLTVSLDRRFEEFEAEMAEYSDHIRE